MLESVLSIPEGMLSLEDKGRNFNIKLSKSINFPHIPILICTPTTIFYWQVENTCTTPSFHWEVRLRDHKASLTQPFVIQLPKSERSWIFVSRGGSSRGRTQRAPPPKIGKHGIFWGKIVIFFLSAPSPILKSWIRPWLGVSILSLSTIFLLDFGTVSTVWYLILIYLPSWFELVIVTHDLITFMVWAS